MAHFSIMEVFGANIQKCLDANGWTKQQLADATGIDRANISRIIAGRTNCTLSSADVIAKALEIPLSELLSTKFKIHEFAA